MPVTVTLAGPAPWGFRITGGRDFGKPITVSKVTEHGKAAAGDLRPGDIIVAINGESTAEMLNVEAQNKIKQSPGQLRLQVERSPMPPPSHANGDASPERLATRFQVSPGQPLHTPAPHPGLIFAGPGTPLMAPSSPPSSQPLEEEFACPGFSQERGSLSRQNSSPGSILPAPPRPPSPGLRAPPNPWETCRERRRSSTSPSPCNSLGSEPAMRRLEEDSEVYKMLQENRELRAAPRQSSTFRLLQEALEDEGGGEGVQGEMGGGWPGAVRIQDGRYRHPSCYACADCGLNLKMRGHFWVGDELYCEKHARLRYQGAPGVPAAPPVTPHS
ncbi:PDLI2 protein, partial [Mesembrinibis cayennensis]|nr:PDLI2 protein [Mesembrinibis cayennensis]